MAETNAVDPGGPVGSTQGSQLGASPTRPAEGIGGVNLDASRSAVDAATMDALFKLGSGMLDPAIQADKTAQFLDGVNRVASGEALKDVVESRPWYSELFGPSSAVAGARAYSTQMQIAKFGADMENQMPILAQQGPEALTAAAAKSIESVKTGDPAADAAIMGAYVDQLTPLYKRHAKENYIFNQDKANRAQVGTWGTLAASYQKAARSHADGVTTAEDLAAEQDTFIGNFIPFGGQTDASYEKNVAQFLQGAAAGGNFQVIKYLKGQGLIEKLAPEVQAALHGTFRAAGRETLNQLTLEPDFALEMARISRDTTQNPRLIPEKIKALNAKAAAATGVDVEDAQLIPGQQADNIMGSIMTAQAAQAAAGNSKLDTLREQQGREAIAYSQLLLPGAVDQGLATGKLFNDSAAEVALEKYWTENTDPLKRAEVLRSRGGDGAYKVAKADMSTMLLTEVPTQGVTQVASTWEAMKDSTLRGKYFSADQNAFLQVYSASLRAGIPPEAAFTSAKIVRPLAGLTIPTAEKQEAQKEIRRQVESRNEEWYGRNKVTDSALRTIETLTNAAYQQNRTLFGTKAAINQAYGSALSNNLAVIGKHAVIQSPEATPFKNVFADPSVPGHMGEFEGYEAFNSVFEKEAKARNGNTDDYTIYRQLDGPKGPRFTVMMQDDKGATITFGIDGAQIRAQGAEAYRQSQTPKLTPPSTGAGRGAKTTMNAGPGALSIPSPFQ